MRQFSVALFQRAARSRGLARVSTRRCPGEVDGQKHNKSAEKPSNRADSPRREQKKRDWQDRPTGQVLQVSVAEPEPKPRPQRETAGRAKGVSELEREVEGDGTTYALRGKQQATLYPNEGGAQSVGADTVTERRRVAPIINKGLKRRRI